MGEFVWSFPLDKEVDKWTQEKLIGSVSDFLADWKAHGKPLSSRVSLAENRFLIVRVNEEIAQASGCSKDKLYHFIENECQKLGFNLAPGHLFFIRTEQGIASFSRKELRENIEKNRLFSENEIFTTWITDGKEWGEKWGKQVREVLPGISHIA